MSTVRSTAMVVLVAVGWSVGSVTTAEAQKRQRDVITRDEIDASAMKNLDIFQVIRSLRPHFLAPPRGVRSFGASNAMATVLYVNGNKMGDISGLKIIMAQDVEEVRYYEPSKAADEFGTEHSGGAVAVKLLSATPKTPPKPPAP